MKKLLFAACALAALFSCAKELTELESESSAKLNPESQSFTIVTARSSEDAVKTSLGEKDAQNNRPVFWQTTDCINVNGNSSTAINIDSGNASVANFVVSGELSYPYCSAYPESAVKGFEAGSFAISLPAVQNYTEGSFDPSAAVMLGYAASGDIVFHNAMSFMKIIVSGGSDSDAVKSVRIRANYDINAEVANQGREAMSGDFVGLCSEGELSLSRTARDNASVTLDCGTGVAQGNEMIVAIPANTYKKGINLFIVDVNNHCQEIVSSREFTAEPGVMYSSTVQFNGGSTYVGSGIYTASDWNAFAAQVTLAGNAVGFEEDGVVNLRSDITTTKLQRVGGLFAEDEGGQNINLSFGGTFNGNNNTITTTAMGTPLFSYISGTIKDLKIGGTKNIVDNTGHGTLMLGIDVTGSVDNVDAAYEVTAPWPDANSKSLYFGLVRYIAEGSEVKNCDVSSNYTVPKFEGTKASGKGYIYVLPLASSNMGTIDNCTYSGTVSFAEDPGEGLYIAPVQNNIGTISNFTNTGNIIARSSLNSRIAGVAVYGGGNFTNCVHGEENKASEKGTITLTVQNSTAAARYVTIGGIAAYGEYSGPNPITKEDVTTSGYFQNCKNYGDMMLDNRNSQIIFDRTAMGGIVGDVTIGTYANPNEHNYCVIKGSTNSGHLAMLSDAAGSKGKYAPMFLGGIVGLVLSPTGNSGYLIQHASDSGVYFASGDTNMNTGTLEMTSPATAAVAVSAAGVSYGYVGGIAGFTYGLTDNYTILRGSSNCTIKVGCKNAGNIVSGGICGGCCYTKLDQPATVVVDYRPTDYNIAGVAAQYRGMIAGAIGFGIKSSVIRGAINVTMTDNTGLPCSSALAADQLVGFAGMTSKSGCGDMKITVGRSSYNGETIVADNLSTYTYGKTTAETPAE